MVVACIALVFAMTGAGYAAGMLGPNTVGTKQLKKNAVISSKVKNRSLLAVDFKAGQLPRGAQGPQGPQGAQGVQGPAGPITGDAPAGVTLRGTYTVAQTGSTAFTTTEIEFVLRLGAAPTVHYINTGTPPPAECPGTLTNPQATAGNLCLYEGNATNTTNRGVFSPETPGGTIGVATREGAGVFMFPATTSQAYIWGSWAVTSAAAASPGGSPGRPHEQLVR